MGKFFFLLTFFPTGNDENFVVITMVVCERLTSQ